MSITSEQSNEAMARFLVSRYERIVVWAMQYAPIALVSVLRESSVVIAALMSIWVLKEETTVRHLLSTLLVAAGVILAHYEVII